MFPFFFLFLALAVVGIGVYKMVQGQASTIKSQVTEQMGRLENASSLEVNSESSEDENQSGSGFGLKGEKDLFNKEIENLDQNEQHPLNESKSQELVAEENEAIEPASKEEFVFEKYVVGKFNPKYFRLDHWTGDKFVAKRFDRTPLDPDIQVTINTAEGRFPLAVECKWRNRQDGDYIWFAEDEELAGYQEFSKKTGKPTFIALGLDGKPSEPEEVYLIPVLAFKRGTQHHASLTHFRKPNPEQGFFFDVESGVLM